MLHYAQSLGLPPAHQQRPVLLGFVLDESPASDTGPVTAVVKLFARPQQDADIAQIIAGVAEIETNLE